METIGHGRPRAHLIAAVAIVATAMAVGAPATAAAKGKPVQVKLAGVSQSRLVDKGTVKVSVKSPTGRRARLSIAVVQGGDRTKVARKAKSKLKAGKRKQFKVALNDDGKRLVQSCITTKFVATAQTGSGRELGRAKASMKRDPARCDGSNPVGVDLANADRCDFDHPAGRGMPVPVPERLLHEGRSVDRHRPAAQPERGVDARQLDPASTSTRPTSTGATGSAPAP